MRVIVTLVAIATLGCHAGHLAHGAGHALVALARVSEAVVATAVVAHELSEDEARRRCEAEAEAAERRGEEEPGSSCRCRHDCDQR